MSDQKQALLPQIKVISHTKKIAQCQIVVDFTLLYGFSFFERIRNEFMNNNEITPSFSWLREFINRKDSVKDFDDTIMRYFILIDAYKNPDFEKIPEEYIACPVFRQLYKIRNLIKEKKEQDIIDLFKLNQSGISEYKAMIKRYIRKAKEAGAIIIFFPEFSFTNIQMGRDVDFMNLTRDCTIIAGGIKDVPFDEREIVLEYTKEIITKRKELAMIHLNEEEIGSRMQYSKWLADYEKYKESVLSSEKSKALYYNITHIFKDGKEKYAIKNTNTAREIKWNIVPGFSYSLINSRLFNIILINCEDFTIPTDEYEGHNKQIIDIINYTEGKIIRINWENDILLEYMRKQKIPITTTAVISYKENPEDNFTFPFYNLFKKTEIGLGLYTNSGTTNIEDIFGHTGLYCRTIHIEDIKSFDSIKADNIKQVGNGEFTYNTKEDMEILKISPIDINGRQTGYRIYFAAHCRYGMLVSSYMDDPQHPYLTDIEIYLPKAGDNGELESIFRNTDIFNS